MLLANMMQMPIRANSEWWKGQEEGVRGRAVAGAEGQKVEEGVPVIASTDDGASKLYKR